MLRKSQIRECGQPQRKYIDVRDHVWLNTYLYVMSHQIDILKLHLSNNFFTKDRTGPGVHIFSNGVVDIPSAALFKTQSTAYLLLYQHLGTTYLKVVCGV